MTLGEKWKHVYNFINKVTKSSPSVPFTTIVAIHPEFLTGMPFTLFTIAAHTRAFRLKVYI